MEEKLKEVFKSLDDLTQFTIKFYGEESHLKSLINSVLKRIVDLNNCIRKEKEKDLPDKVSFWWMNDNHTFVELYGKTVDEIISHACSMQEQDPCGMLCGPNLLKGNIQVRKIPCIVFGDEWTWSNLEKWKKTVMEDPDVARIMKKKALKNEMEEL